MTKRFTRSTAVQSVLFDRKRWTITKAKEWLKKKGYKVPAVDSTADYHRFRQDPPFRFKAGTFRTINFGAARTGIKAVIAVPRVPQKTKNPSKSEKPKKAGHARVPATLVDLATPLEIDLDGDRVLKFPLRDNWALCANQKGDELWIVSKKGGRVVSTRDKEGHELYEKFTGFEHDNRAKLLSANPRKMHRLGRAETISYRSDKFSGSGDDSDYVHDFRKQPLVSVDNMRNPRIVAIRGGNIKVKEEGITG